MSALDPIDFEVVKEKLNMIVEEAKEIFVRSGVSSMLRSGDVSVGLYTAKGDMVPIIMLSTMGALTLTSDFHFTIKLAPDPPLLSDSLMM